MAVGDEATAADYPLVPDTGEDGKVKWGAREINRTRDFIAQIKSALPTGHLGYQAASGITQGSSAPANASGANGDIYLQIIG